MKSDSPYWSTRKDGKLSGAWEEKVYAGVHSDVGGGYVPDAQGISDNYSRVPMRDMMRESVVSGVRIRSYEEVEQWRSQLFKERFFCDPATLMPPQRQAEKLPRSETMHIGCTIAASTGSNVRQTTGSEKIAVSAIFSCCLAQAAQRPQFVMAGNSPCRCNSTTN